MIFIRAEIAAARQGTDTLKRPRNEVVTCTEWGVEGPER